MLTVILFVIIFGYCWLKLSSKPPNFPPGPYRWPIIGNLLEFKLGGLQPHFVAADLRRRYGNVMAFYLSSSPVVLVSGLDEIRELLSHPGCQGRPAGAVRKYNNDVNGILFTQGHVWKDQRRFALRHLRDLGLGKRELETFIHEEIQDMLQEARKRAGKDFSSPVATIDLVNATGANVIFHMIAGARFQRGEPRLTKLVDMIKTATTVNDASGGIANSFPFLLKYAQWLTEYKNIMKPRLAVKNFLLEHIKEHQNKHIDGDQHDFIDFYLTEMNKQAQGSTFHLDQLCTVCYDLFVAGSDTTVGALSFALLYMLLELRVQKKVHDELDSVIGRERLPSVDDKSSLPYICAVIQEALRMSNTVTLSVPHATTEEVHFRGYVIPKDTRLIVNLYALHMDPAVWGDPETFRPERFIGAKGELLTHEALMPFGQGKRSCLGESMARTNLFLTFSALLQNFTLSLPEGAPTPSSKQVGGFVLTPEPFKAIFTPRS